MRRLKQKQVVSNFVLFFFLFGLVGWSNDQAIAPPIHIEPSEIGQIARLVPQTGGPEDVTADELTQLVASMNAFSVDLYQQLRESEDGNIFYSPNSIWVALAMAYAGALEDTESEMALLLHDTMAPDRLHMTVAALASILESRIREGDGEDVGIELNIANALWADEELALRDEFVQLLADLYESDENRVDFQDGEHTAQLINAWANEHTNGHIPQIVDAHSFNRETVLALTNAIYFAGSWASAFTESATFDAPFYLLDGRETMVPMMNQMAEFRYGEGEDYQAVVLPYEGGELEMVILLPRDGYFSEFEDGLTPQRLNEMIAVTYLSEVEVYLPRFELDTSYGLNDVLQAMGMVSAFDRELADFGDMAHLSPIERIYIQAVLHKAHLEVDESGTVAAAVTVIIGGMITSVSEPFVPPVFRADRPFIPMIRDAETGTILFMGRVLNPNA